jgi:hypothetical protein
MHKTFAALLMAATAALVAPAAAAPLVYSEAVDGAFLDLNFNFNEAGTLDVGTNTVTGSRDAIERFSVILPSTLRLTDVTVLISNITLREFRSRGQVVLSGDVSGSSPTFTANDTYDLYSATFEGPGVIGVNLFGFTIGSGNVGVSYDYTVSFTVDRGPLPVPEPLGLALFGAGLAGLAAARRRKA